MPNSRRQFLSRSASAAAITFSGRLPVPLLAAVEKKKAPVVLVVIELQGGNDGLNTVVPTSSETYRRLRPNTGIAAGNTLSISSDCGFHPQLQGFAELLEQGKLGIVNGVGYDNPNRSHFESMDIWHTCQRSGDRRPEGWLGRWIESAQRPAGDLTALHLGDQQLPLALKSQQRPVPSIRSKEQFRLRAANADQLQQQLLIASETAESTDDLLGFIRSSTSTALQTSQRIQAIGRRSTTATVWPDGNLSRKLQTVSGLIRAGLETSVYYLSLGGFDTHAQQPDAHGRLLRQLGDATAAFMRDLAETEHADRVMLMCFSEFGRRVAENASAGTDHGTAGPVFLIGNQVLAGLHGDLPDLNQLENDDLKYHTDFRQVYADVLENWFQTDSREILSGSWLPSGAIRS
jgi:uncharacterized protein (DUF1501 family)